MKDVSQTKEGFIKSMILFVVLLGICFAPFFAFSKTTEFPSQSTVSVITADPGMSFELVFQKNQVQVDFQTASTCKAYAIEGKMAGSDVWQEIFYCHDALCMDAYNGINFNFWVVEYPYDFFRVKITTAKGETKYSQEKQILNTKPEIELLNNAVNSNLYLDLTSTNTYTYSIMGTNGKVLAADLGLESNEIDLSYLETGFYIISFKSENGIEYHYSFLKQ